MTLEIVAQGFVFGLKMVYCISKFKKGSMWDEIQDMPGEIFDLEIDEENDDREMDIDDRELMPPDMQLDILKEDPMED